MWLSVSEVAIIIASLDEKPLRGNSVVLATIVSYQTLNAGVQAFDVAGACFNIVNNEDEDADAERQ